MTDYTLVKSSLVTLKVKQHFIKTYAIITVILQFIKYRSIITASVVLATRDKV